MESREGRSVLEGRLEVALKEAEQVNLLPLLVFFLDAIASPSTYPCQSVGEWVSGDSYRISELCELVQH